MAVETNIRVVPPPTHLSSAESDSEPSFDGCSDCEESQLLTLQRNVNMELLLQNVNKIPKCALPPLNYVYSNQFLRAIESSFHMAMAYNDKSAQESARKLIPVFRLEVGAQKRLRELQGNVLKSEMEDPDISIQDMLILELLNWFKKEFFKWVDSPECLSCGGKTKYSHMAKDTARYKHTDRVEMHSCITCSHETPYPRYNDVNVLLVTRSGRCGEWANAFTLMCCAMGWDARYVVDRTDHVWTEVYSFAQKRWLHCDPCENICDTPLIYEHGWGKQLSYVIACSSDEVQDVTWRYSGQHKELLTRRKLCTERELIDCLVKLRGNRQSSFTSARRDFLTRRLVLELVELMVEPKPKQGDSQGRTSGSLDWRLTRGETQECRPFSWTLSSDDLDGAVCIRYSAATDCYEYIGTARKLGISKWHSATFRFNNMFHKEETDWKMAYLARKENEAQGSITWKFEVEGSQKVIDLIDIRFEYKLYEDGKLALEMRGDDDVFVQYETGISELKTAAFSGCKSFTLIANLSGGRGDVAWQHAQLFRQSTKDREHFPFSLTFSFKNK